uniref:Phosphatidic acid phosphatase type 2/haloperoxidase domain-containing protein n=1 Tax=Pyrodinium bahamense TaxID=73915 RepID=A0A7S0FCX9_9DINO|mmetsp:Transcript_21659/g.60109  ORF Transcript_21659/g.60109 Transcript_21659/m.60109 type:complete len:251 (+) Transcript_21659:106-858(+)
MKLVSYYLHGVNASRNACLPEWSLQDKPCPHGHVSGVPLSHFTWHQDGASWVDYAAAFYATAPFALAVGFPAWFLWTRGTKEILGTAFFWLLALVVVVLKLAIGQPRPPGSCLTSCGMPSGHTLESVGFFAWLLLEVARSQRTSSLGKCLLLACGGTLLLPVGWSRTVSQDHSWPQVIAGGAIGVCMGAGWFWLLNQRCTYWLLKLAWLHLPFLTRNYPPDGVEEETSWGEVHGAGAAGSAGRLSGRLAG